MLYSDWADVADADLDAERDAGDPAFLGLVLLLIAGAVGVVVGWVLRGLLG